ncbi:hypothetical protein GEMRC1_012742 [Eukaryota sp. GEM-RC1]
MGIHTGTLKLETNEDRGRHFIATEPCNPGDVLISSHCYAKAVCPEFHGIVCEYCFTRSRSNTLLMRCSRCKSAYYCSTTCQKLDYQLHKLECNTGSLSKLLNRTRDSAAVLALRILLRKDVPPLGLTNEGSFEDVLSLCSADLLGSSSPSKIDHITSSVGHALPEHVSSSKIRKILKRIGCNAFTITNEELVPLGAGMFPAASYANHSCTPNACFMFKGTQIALIAIKDILEGEEVTVNYVPLIEPLSLRRENIRKHFNFICRCDRCSEVEVSPEVLYDAVIEYQDEVEKNAGKFVDRSWVVVEALMQQVMCATCEGYGILCRSGFYCPCAKPLVHPGFDRFNYLRTKGRHCVSQFKWGEAQVLFEEALTLVDTDSVVGSYHFELRLVLSDYADCCVNLCTWSQAAKVFTKLLDSARLVYPKRFPLIGVLKFARAKVMSLVDGEYGDKDILNAFRTAHKGLCVTHKATCPQIVADCIKGLEEFTVAMRLKDDRKK